MSFSASWAGDGTVTVWDLLAGRDPDPLLPGDPLHVLGVAFSPKGDEFAVAGSDANFLGKREGELRVLEWPSCRERYRRIFKSGVLDVTYAPDGNNLVIGQGFNVHLLDRKGEVLRSVDVHRQASKTVFSPEGRWIALAGSGGWVALWDRSTGEQHELIPAGQQFSWSGLSFSPDGKTLAIAGGASGQPGHAELWDITAGQKRIALEGLNSPVLRIAFSADGNTLATASSDRLVRLWNLDGSLRASLAGHSGQVQALAFSPDGKSLASAGQDGLVKVWDPVRGQDRATLHGHNNSIRCLAFHPNCKALLSGGWEHSLRMWLAD
jgi:WD40 repeat protein